MAKRERETSEYVGMIRRGIRALGRRVGDMDAEALPYFDQARLELDQAEYAALTQLRQDYSWGELAQRMGMTRQGVIRRYQRLQARCEQVA